MFTATTLVTVPYEPKADRSLIYKWLLTLTRLDLLGFIITIKTAVYFKIFL